MYDWDMWRGFSNFYRLQKAFLGCPPPKICGRNCGIYIDERSCQSCQCLWISTRTFLNINTYIRLKSTFRLACTTDLDCRDVGQFCDLGRCECATGYIHDETQSGVCRFNSTPPENGRNRHRQQGCPIKFFSDHLLKICFGIFRSLFF